MVSKKYIPDQGDIILIDLDPQKGTEMSKRRPCLVLSKKELNKVTNRALICPITSTPPASLLQVSLPPDQKFCAGTIVMDQLKTVDFHSRNAHKIDELNDPVLYLHIVDLIHTIIEP